jgi:hypothetical protein
MSQRTIQRLVTEFLSVDAEKLQILGIERFRRTTSINLSIGGFPSPKVHQQYQPRSIQDYPDTDWELEGAGGAVSLNWRSAINQLTQIHL